MRLIDTLTALRSRPFVRQLAVLVSGTLVVQVMNLAFIPLIVRLFGPEAYGILGIFVAVAAVLLPVAALCLPMAIVLAQSHREARRLAVLSLQLAGLLSALLMGIVLVFQQPLAALLNISAVADYLWLLPVMLFFTAGVQVLQHWLIRLRAFGVLAKSEVLTALLLNAGKLAFGYWQPVAAALIGLTVVAKLIHAGALYGLAAGSGQPTLGQANTPAPGGSVAGAPTPPSPWQLLRVYRAFPLFQAPQAWLNAAAQSLPVIMLAALFGPLVAGFYTLAKTVLAVPSTLLGKAVGDVFYPHFTQAHQAHKPLAGLLLKATLGLLVLGAVPYLLVMAIGPWLFTLAFGDAWLESGQFAQWMALWLWCVFFNSPSVKAVVVLRIQHWAIALNSVTLLLRLGALWYAAAWWGTALAALQAFVVMGVLHNVLFVLMALFRARQHDRNTARLAGSGNGSI